MFVFSLFIGFISSKWVLKECTDINKTADTTLRFVFTNNTSYYEKNISTGTDYPFYDSRCFDSTNFRDFHKKLNILLYFDQHYNLGSLSKFNSTSTISFFHGLYTSIKEVVNATLTFDSGVREKRILDIKNNNFLLIPAGDSSKTAFISLSVTSKGLGFSHGNQTGPVLFLTLWGNNNNNNAVDYSAFSKIYLSDDSYSRLFLLDDKVSDDKPNNFENMPGMITIVEPTDPQNFMYYNYIVQKSLPRLSYLNFVSLESGCYDINVFDTYVTITGKSTGLSARYEFEYTSFLINLAGESIEISFYSNTTKNHLHKIFVRNDPTNNVNIFIKDGTWHVPLVFDDDEALESDYKIPPYSYFYLEAADCKNVEITGKDVYFFLSHPTTTIRKIYCESIHAIPVDDSRKTFKSIDCLVTNIIPYMSVDFIFGNLNLSPGTTLHKDVNVKVTYLLTIAAKTLSDKPNVDQSEVEKSSPRYVEVGDEALVNIQNSLDENGVILTEDVTFPSSTYYIDFPNQHTSTNKEKWVLCQPNLDCGKFEISFKGFDYHYDPSKYEQVGEIYEPLCRDYTEIYPLKVGCCETDSTNNFTKSLKCIGYRSTRDLNSLKSSATTIPDPHEDFESWKSSLQEHVNQFNYKAINTIAHPLYVEGDTLTSGDFFDNGDGAIDTYVEIGDNYWKSPNFTLSAKSKVYFRHLQDDQKITIPFKRISLNGFLNPLTDLIFTQVEEVILPLSTYHSKDTEKNFVDSKYAEAFKDIKYLDLARGSTSVSLPTNHDSKFNNENVIFKANNQQIFVECVDDQWNTFQNDRLRKNISIPFPTNPQLHLPPLILNSGFKQMRLEINTPLKYDLDLTVKGSLDISQNENDIRSNVTIRADTNPITFANTINYNLITSQSTLSLQYVSDKNDGSGEIKIRNLTVNSNSKVNIKLFKYNPNKITIENMKGLISKVECTYNNNTNHTCDRLQSIEIGTLTTTSSMEITEIPVEKMIDNKKKTVFIPVKVNNYIHVTSSITVNTSILGKEFRGFNIVSNRESFPLVFLDDLESETKPFPLLNVTRETSKFTCEPSSRIYYRLHETLPEFDGFSWMEDENPFQKAVCSTKLTCSQLEDKIHIMSETFELCFNQHQKITSQCFSNVIQLGDNHFSGETFQPVNYTCVSFRFEDYNLTQEFSVSVEKSTGLSSGAIAGIVIAVIIVIIIIIILLVVFVFKKKGSTKSGKNSDIIISKGVNGSGSGSGSGSSSS